MENIKGMTTCKVCGRDFPLLAEEHYVSKDVSLTGFAGLAGGTEPKIWDSFDCPHCGCQNRIQLRNRVTNDFGQGLPLIQEDEEEDCCCCDMNPHSSREEE